MITVNGTVISKNTFKFPGGELGVSLKNVEGPTTSVEVEALLLNSDDIMELALITSAIREALSYGKIPMELRLLYFPYGRQDRVCNEGEAHGVKVMAGIINLLGYDRVGILDPHSDAVIAAVNNSYPIEQHLPAADALEDLVRKQHYELVCPDAGAEKKINRLAKELGAWGLTPPVHYASKKRNLATGEITATEIDGDFTDKDLILVDDICDGGRTFIELAKVLRAKGARKLVLYVTHGIFSKGMDELKEYFDHVYAAYAFKEPGSMFLTLGVDLNNGGLAE